MGYKFDNAVTHHASLHPLQLVRKNGSPYLFKLSDSFRCKVFSIAGKAEIPFVVEPTSLVDESTIKVSFTARVSGTYRMNFLVNDQGIGGTEVFRKYLPGVCVESCCLLSIMCPQTVSYTPLSYAEWADLDNV